MQPEYATFLAACVRERRRELNYSLDDVIAAGGPTRRTLVRVEAATLGPAPKPVTFRRLDTALCWQNGSAARAYWTGDKPHPEALGRTLDAGTAVVEVPAALALGLFEAQVQLNLAARDPLDPRQLEAAVAGINLECGRLIGLYLTDLLERNRDGDWSIPPLLDRAFAGLLDGPVSPEDPDYEDKLYRRWLIGRTSEIPDELAGRFGARLRQARKNAGVGPQ
ncbi:hypothetical protein D7D52_30115 [Nocardia yunnanensis]|uniref:Uncharacterized protein n=1 Tax=Nocardia yunnanensis TaxID=2382165 RepID=A0A386ZIM3_9NOCA|nr:hypothetical protein [Nocardia yunnanensis]AYF77371.1 hypothetical protein D7D52_30115 [Nocardia yunnanensis]